MIIKGHVTSNVNIRSAPLISSTNITGTIYSGQTFEGNEYVKDSLGRSWIKLSFVNGSVKIGYIANYISAVIVDQVISDPVPPSEDLGIPEKVTTIEEFKLSDGSIKKRVIEWTNPQIIGE